MDARAGPWLRKPRLGSLVLLTILKILRIESLGHRPETASLAFRENTDFHAQILRTSLYSYGPDKPDIWL